MCRNYRLISSLFCRHDNSRISNRHRDILAMKIHARLRLVLSPGDSGEAMGQNGIRTNRKFYREQRGETFLYISRRAFIGARFLARSRNARPLINAGIEQTGNRLEQKAPPRTFFHLSNFSHYREISLLLFLPFALDPQIELPSLLPSVVPPFPHILTTDLRNYADNPFADA